MPSSSLQTPLEGERRFVVVLFADIAGFTRLSEQLDPEDATTLVNCCLDTMTRAVLQYEGRLDKYMGDGLMAVFGAPTAHEDDPERALRAALAMQESVGRLRVDLNIPHLSLHLGLACGQVVAAGVGGRGRREYTVIGTAVNMAARLEEASVLNQILVSEDLARLTDHVFFFRPVILPRLQGWDGEVQAFELLGRRPGVAPFRRVGPLQSPLVGRETEVGHLQRCLEELVAGRGGIVCVVGEAGVGKSRLLREVQDQVEEQNLGLTWLEGYSVETGEPVRYGCFQVLLRNAIGVTGQTDPAKIGEGLWVFLEELMPGRASEVHPFLGQMLGMPLAAEVSARWDQESLKWQTFQVVKEWLTVMAERQPLALVFEDLHWVDPLSAELLEQILPLAEQMALLIVGTYRPEPAQPVWHLREICKEVYRQVYTELWLSSLPLTATEQMVSHLLETGQVPQQALELILGRTEGNPLFIEEIVHSMVDQGILIQRDDRWDLAPDWTEVAIPDTIQGILQARIDRLDKEAKRELQVAACVGRRFSYGLLAGISEAVGVPRHRLARCLKTLEEAALIQRETGLPFNGTLGVGRPPGEADADNGWDREYTFRHVLIRDTVHSSLLKSTRAQLHTAVAWWYEENTLQDLEPPYDLLAYHYEQTDNEEKKQLYFVQAGHQAARGYANAEARTFFTKALALVVDPAARFDLLMARERVCRLIGDRVQQKADLEELLQLANRGDDHGQRAIIYNRFAAWHGSQGDYPAARAAARKGYAAALPAGDAHAEAESLHRIASAAWRQGEFTAALEAAQSALEVARTADNAMREATSLTTMGIVYRSCGELASARTCHQQALDIRRAIGNRRGEAISLNLLADDFCSLGQYTDALDYHEQALDIFCLVGDRQGEAWSLRGLGTVYLHCGDHQAAQSYYEDTLAIRRAIGDRRGEGVAMSDLGNALLAMGEQKAAKAHLEQAAALLREIGARRDEVFSLTYLARAMEKAGDLNGAQATHQVALSRRRELGQQPARMENVSGLARVALAHGDLDTARALVAEMLSHIREFGLAQIRFPFLVYQTCVEVLQACAEDKQAHNVLKDAHDALQDRARRIADPKLRRSYLEQVPEHRWIVAAWRGESTQR